MSPTFVCPCVCVLCVSFRAVLFLAFFSPVGAFVFLCGVVCPLFGVVCLFVVLCSCVPPVFELPNLAVRVLCCDISVGEDMGILHQVFDIC